MRIANPNARSEVKAKILSRTSTILWDKCALNLSLEVPSPARWPKPEGFTAPGHPFGRGRIRHHGPIVSTLCRSSGPATTKLVVLLLGY
jgi:hypothetical protein